MKQPSIAMAVLATVLLGPVSVVRGVNPAWWTTRGVVTSNTPNDFAGVNLGQLKQFAYQAWLEMTNGVPGGPGAAISNMVTGFLNSNNYAAANLGQLKAVAQPFYDRLLEVQYTNSHAYAWTTAANDDANLACANIGQLKTVFNFAFPDTDGDRMPDWWELSRGLNPTNAQDASGDIDGDGLANVDEFTRNTDEHSPDTDSDGYQDSYEVAQGSDPREAASLPPPTGAQYYVATNGSNSHDGRTTTSAWQTIDFAVNNIHSGGVLHVRGGEYREHVSLTNNTGRSATNYMHVLAYSNELVTIKGSRLVGGWLQYSTYVWKVTNWLHNSQQVFVNGEPLQQLGWANDYFKARITTNANWEYIPYGFSIGNVTSPPAAIVTTNLWGVFTNTCWLEIGNPLTNMGAGTFYYETSSLCLFVRLKDGSSPTNKTVEASTEDGVFSDNSTSGCVHIRGLSFAHCSSMASHLEGYPCVALGGPNDIIENCSIEWGDAVGLSLVDNCKALRCRLANNGKAGGEGINRATNFLISSCTVFSNNYRAFGPNYAAAGLKSIPHVGGTIESNEIAFNWGCGIWFDICHSNKQIFVRNNYVHDNQPPAPRPGDPYTYPVSGVFIEASDHADVYNNLIVSNAGMGIRVARSEGCRVLNNTVIGTRRVYDDWDGLSAIRMDDRSSEYPLRNNVIMNNIIANNACDYDISARSSSDTDVSSNHIDHNLMYSALRGAGVAACYYMSDDTNVSFTTGSLTNWTARTGWDSNSISSNPQFTACTGSEYLISGSSPAVDAGGAAPGLVYDLRGARRPYGTNYDLGAYEHIP